MTERLVPTVRTVITPDAYVSALIGAWLRSEGVTASRDSVGVLWAHYALETGSGAHCYCFNLGNVKHVAGDGHDYCQLRGVWEGVTAESFAILRRPPLGHLVRLDPSEDHRRAVGPGKLAVIFDPPHPASSFRAYPSLQAAMDEHFGLLKTRRYANAWPSVREGDPTLFAQRLKERGYYTASVLSYAAGLRTHFDRYLASGVYEAAIARREAPTAPEVASVEDNAITDVDVGPILHPMVPFPSYRDDDNVMVRDMLVVHEEACGAWTGNACSCVKIAVDGENT